MSLVHFLGKAAAGQVKLQVCFHLTGFGMTFAHFPQDFLWNIYRSHVYQNRFFSDFPLFWSPMFGLRNTLFVNKRHQKLSKVKCLRCSKSDDSKINILERKSGSEMCF